MIHVDLDPRVVGRLDAVAAHVRDANPGVVFTRSDVVREGVRMALAAYETPEMRAAAAEAARDPRQGALPHTAAPLAAAKEPS